MMFGCVLIYLVCFLYFRLLNADPKNFAITSDNEFDELKSEIAIWKKTYQMLTPMTKNEKIVKTLLKEKASQLQNLLSQHVYENKRKFEQDLKKKSQIMVEGYKINNKSLLAKCCLIFSATLILVKCGSNYSYYLKKKKNNYFIYFSSFCIHLFRLFI